MAARSSAEVSEALGEPEQGEVVTELSAVAVEAPVGEPAELDNLGRPTGRQQLFGGVDDPVSPLRPVIVLLVVGRGGVAPGSPPGGASPAVAGEVDEAGGAGAAATWSRAGVATPASGWEIDHDCGHERIMTKGCHISPARP